MEVEMNTSYHLWSFFSCFSALSIATSLIKMKNAFEAYAIKKKNILYNKTSSIMHGVHL